MFAHCSLTLPIILGTIKAASIPKIAMTIINSTSVKPSDSINFL